ncbi:MAG TPA: alkaline phosphatase family protein [Nocardioidaceae bacterium]|nr:alkaline phosphatase family protein [Nocardioidaceae bacterium]
MILPEYGSASLPDLLPSIGAALGVGAQRTDGREPYGRHANGQAAAAGIDLPAAPRYVLLLIDGLGLDLLADHAEDAPYLSSLLAGEQSRALTVGVPTTTATSLTSLGTGLPPGRHGVVGYTSRIPGSNRLLNALRWDSRVDPREWQPHRTAFDRLSREGVATHVVSKRAFEKSGLTVAGQRGASYVGADTAGERIAETVRVLGERSAGSPSMVYVYDSDLDSTGHRDGCASEAWRFELATVDAFAARLRSQIPDDAVLVVTADHGMVDVAPDDRVDVDTEVDLLDDVGVFAGEGRLRHLYCRAGAVDEVAARWRARLSSDAWVVTREQAVADGWFGPQVDREVTARIGDVLVACAAPIAILSSKRFPMEVKLIGLHGSLTHAEMVVPLLVDAGPSAGGSCGR